MVYGAIEEGILFLCSEKDVITKAMTSEEKKSLKEKIGIDSSKKMILAVRQIIYRKGFDLLEKAAEKLPDYDIYIIGGSNVSHDNIHYLEFIEKMN